MGLLAEQFDQPRRFPDSFGPREGQEVNMQGIADYLDKYAEREEAFRLRPDTFTKYREAPPEEPPLGVPGGKQGNEDVYSQRVDESDRAAWLTGTGDLGAGTYDSFGKFTNYLDKEFGLSGYFGDRVYPDTIPEFADVSGYGAGLLGSGASMLIGGPLGMGVGLLGQGIDYSNRLEGYNEAIAKYADSVGYGSNSGVRGNVDRGFWESLFSPGWLRDQSYDRLNAVTQRAWENRLIAPQQALREEAMYEIPDASPAPVADPWSAIVDRAPAPVMEALQRAADLQKTIRREDLQEAIRREDDRNQGSWEDAWGGGSTSSQAMRERSDW